MVLHDSRAGFDPVPGVDVVDHADPLHHGLVDVPAQHDVGAVAHGIGRDGVLEVADEVHGALHLLLAPGRERPVGQAQRRRTRLIVLLSQIAAS